MWIRITQLWKEYSGGSQLFWVTVLFMVQGGASALQNSCLFQEVSFSLSHEHRIGVRISIFRNNTNSCLRCLNLITVKYSVSEFLLHFWPLEIFPSYLWTCIYTIKYFVILYVLFYYVHRDGRGFKTHRDRGRKINY